MYEFEASYIVRPCLKTNVQTKQPVVVHTFNPISWEAEVGGSPNPKLT